MGGSGVSVAAELRLPTGASENLLGADRAAFKVLGIGSIQRGRLATDVNVGLLTGGVSDEFDYSAAVTFAGAARVTIIGEVLGRRYEDLGTMSNNQPPIPRLRVWKRPDFYPTTAACTPQRSLQA